MYYPYSFKCPIRKRVLNVRFLLRAQGVRPNLAVMSLYGAPSERGRGTGISGGLFSDTFSHNWSLESDAARINAQGAAQLSLLADYFFPPSLPFHFISRADPQIAHDPVRRTRSYDRGKRIAPFWTCFPQHTYTKKKKKNNVGEDRVDEIQRNLVSIQTGASLKAHRRTQWCCPLYIYIYFFL